MCYHVKLNLAPLYVIANLPVVFGLQNGNAGAPNGNANGEIPLYPQPYKPLKLFKPQNGENVLKQSNPKPPNGALYKLGNPHENKLAYGQYPHVPVCAFCFAFLPPILFYFLDFNILKLIYYI